MLNEKYLEIFRNPKTNKIYRHPIITEDGKIFEKREFKKMCLSKNYFDNKHLKEQIGKFLGDNPFYIDQVYKSDKSPKERIIDQINGKKIESLLKAQNFDCKDLNEDIFILSDEKLKYIFENTTFDNYHFCIFIILSIKINSRPVFNILFKNINNYYINNERKNELVFNAIIIPSYFYNLEDFLSEYRFTAGHIISAIRNGHVDLVLKTTKDSHYFNFTPSEQHDIFLFSLKSGNIGIIEGVFKNIFHNSYIFDNEVFEKCILKYNNYKNIIKMIGMFNPNKTHLLRNFSFSIEENELYVKPEFDFNNKLNEKEIFALYFLIKNL